MSKRVSVVVTVTLVILLIVATAWFIYGSRAFQHTKTADNNIAVISNPKNILLSLEQYLSSGVSLPVGTHLLKSIPIETGFTYSANYWNVQGFSAVPLGGISISLVSNSDPSLITQDYVNSYQNSINSFFLANKFQQDSNNTYTNNNRGFTVTGYTKGVMNCWVELEAQSEPFGDAFCGAMDQSVAEWNGEVGHAILNNHNGSLVTVYNLAGNYATGSLVSPADHRLVYPISQWYAVKIEGKWQEVWYGRNGVNGMSDTGSNSWVTPSSSVIQKYNIPQDILSRPSRI